MVSKLHGRCKTILNWVLLEIISGLLFVRSRGYSLTHRSEAIPLTYVLGYFEGDGYGDSCVESYDWFVWWWTAVQSSTGYLWHFSIIHLSRPYYDIYMLARLEYVGPTIPGSALLGHRPSSRWLLWCYVVDYSKKGIKWGWISCYIPGTVLCI